MLTHDGFVPENIPILMSETADSAGSNVLQGGNYGQSQHNTVYALTAKQERQLMDNLEERFLDITRNLKKRFVLRHSCVRRQLTPHA